MSYNRLNDHIALDDHLTFNNNVYKPINVFKFECLPLIKSFCKHTLIILHLHLRK